MRACVLSDVCVHVLVGICGGQWKQSDWEPNSVLRHVRQVVLLAELLRRHFFRVVGMEWEAGSCMLHEHPVLMNFRVIFSHPGKITRFSQSKFCRLCLISWAVNP